MKKILNTPKIILFTSAAAVAGMFAIPMTSADRAASYGTSERVVATAKKKGGQGDDRSAAKGANGQGADRSDAKGDNGQGGKKKHPGKKKK